MEPGFPSSGVRRSRRPDQLPATWVTAGHTHAVQSVGRARSRSASTLDNIVGTMNVNHLKENIAAASRPLPADTYAEAKRRLNGTATDQ